MNAIGRTIIALIAIIPSFLFNIANAEVDFTEIVEKASPAVVNISTTQEVDVSKKLFGEQDMLPFDLFEFFERDFGLQLERKRKAHALGSGFIVDPGGYIVTNYHVIEGAEEIKVTIGNESAKSYNAKVIGKDRKTDLALLKIDAKKPLPYLQFGNSDEAKVGSWIIAIGNPFGFGGTVTKGIISAKARYLNTEQYDDYIQTDASINRGNSGSPMLNMQGEVIGVNTVIVSPSGGSIGIGFAIPSAVVQPVVAKLKEKGFVQRGWLGVKVQYVDQDLATAMGLAEPKGALVSEVMKGSPAEKANVKVGDIILKYDGHEVVEMHKLPRLVGKTEINKVVPIELFSEGKIRVANATILKLPNDPAEEESKNHDNAEAKNTSDKSNKLLGMKLQSVDSKLKNKYKIPENIKGVLVLNVDSDSPAAGKIKPGEIIASVGRTPIASIQDMTKNIEALKKRGVGSVALLMYSNNNTRFVTIELK